MNAGREIGFSEDGQPVPIADFDFAAVDPGAVIEDLRAENENLRRDLAYAKSKLPELADLIFEALLCPPCSSAETMKNRTVTLAFIFGCTTLKTQAEVAAVLGITPQAVSKQVDSIFSRFPLLSRLCAM